jgi:hypothetical protein
MNGACEALKEPLEDVFHKFAYLDVELRQTKQLFAKTWSLCTRVRCGEKSDVLVLVMASPELSQSVARSFLGITEPARPGQCIDIISELTNVLAGKAYEILRAGLRPSAIFTPELLEVREATEIWNAAPSERRFAISTETEVLGGILVFSKEEWSRL